MSGPEIFHVTPITPNAALENVCHGRNLMVSFYRPDQLAIVRRIAAKRMADNGRFSEWIAAMKAGKEWSDPNNDNRPYYEWLAPWIDEPDTVAIMPDIPGAPSQLNDGQLLDLQGVDRMTTVNIEARIETATVRGSTQLIAERAFPDHPVMKLATVRSWVRKQYNKAMRDAPRDTIVRASYSGQVKQPPFQFYMGSLSGVNGQTMRVDGDFAS